MLYANLSSLADRFQVDYVGGKVALECSDEEGDGGVQRISF